MKVFFTNDLFSLCFGVIQRCANFVRRLHYFLGVSTLSQGELPLGQARKKRVKVVVGHGRWRSGRRGILGG